MGSSTNRIYQIGSASAGYDAAGDLTYDGTSTYQYDAEGHLVGVTSGSFTWSGIYNALGWRVERTSSSAGRGEYVYGAAGTDLGNFNGGNGAWYEQYVPFDGRVLWYYNALGNKSRYFHVNALGSLGLSTNQTGAPVEEMLYGPFGQGWQSSSGFWWDLKFAKMQTEDVDLQMEMTPHRMYYPLVGRWLTPDPTGGHVTNPQSLNRYAGACPERSRRVTNNPTTLNDPSGLDPWGDPGDRCSDPTYAEGHAQCQGLCDPAYSSYYTNALCNDGFYHGDFFNYDSSYGSGGGGGVSGGTSVGGPPMGGGTGFISPSGAAVWEEIGPESPLIVDTVWACAFLPGCQEGLAAGVAGVALGTLIYEGVHAGVRIYQSSAKKRTVRQIARAYCIDPNLLGQAIHADKKGGPKGTGADLSEERIKELAQELASDPRNRIPGCVPHPF